MRVPLVFAWTLLLLPAVHAAPVGIHVALGDEPDTLKVRWVSEVRGRTGYVDWGEGPFPDREAVAVRRSMDDGASVHEAKLTNLAPNRTYVYRVRNGEEVSGLQAFTTPPSASEAVRVAVWGDQGTPELPQTLLDRPRRVAEWAAASDAHAFLILGDLVYGTGSTQDWLAFLRQTELFARSRPLLVTPGNHERDDGFRRYDAVFGGAPRYGEARLGAAHLVLMDSTRFCADQEGPEDAPKGGAACANGPDPIQVRFLEESLRRARDEGATWILVAHHHPPWSHGRHGPSRALQEAWGRLYDEFEVDLVLTAHDHAYVRSHPLRGDRVDANGTVYVVAGTGGALAYNLSAPPPAWAAAGRSGAFGGLMLEIRPDRLLGRFETVDGEVLDRFELAPRMRRVESGPVAVASLSGVFALVCVLVGAFGARPARLR